MSNASEGAEAPAHVPKNLIFDIDIYNTEGSEADFHLSLKKFHEDEKPDVFWATGQGGHWVVIRHALMMAVLEDTKHFSSRHLVVPRQRHDGIPLYPIHADLPEHTDYRALLAPTFAPKGVRDLSEKAREVAIRLIEGMKSRGHCEFVTEFAQHLPIEIFMSIVNVPAEDREPLLEWADGMVRAPSPEAVHETFGKIFQYAQRLVAERRAKPGDDLISKMLAGNVFGRPMTEAEVVGMCALVLIGGMDTVASAMGFAAWFLARNPEHRRQLIDDPTLIPNAVDELLRRHSVVNLGRYVKADVEVGGVMFKEGDMVVMPTPLGGMDERVFPDPLTVDFKRPNTTEYATFGKGPHRCPGANLGRAELRVFIEEWLKRIPDFQVDPNAKVEMRAGVNGTLLTLPLIWTA